MIMWDSIVIKFYTFLHIQRYIIFYTMTKICIHYVYIFIYLYLYISSTTSTICFPIMVTFNRLINN